ncbi:hypothetical protein SUGI_0702950 [Cryptomeria japonica]|nr:hypothetical protein SUGI_0702950 [Cryptomeria japonica]
MSPVVSTISKDYELKIINTEVIVPALPMQQRILSLSNLGLTIPPVSVHVFFYYKNHLTRTFASTLSHLKTSISKVLVSYYVSAGRMVTDSIGLPKVHCNNKGVRLTQAYAAAALSQLNLYNPDESVQGKLVPSLSKPFQEDGIPFFAAQVTEFGCGGIVVGCTLDHRVADAYSANMFLTSWAKLCRNDSTVPLNPSITRSILCPRDSPAYCAEINNMYGGESGYVMPTQSPAGDGSWIVYMHLPLEQLNAIDSDPNRILIPITQDCLHLA